MSDLEHSNHSLQVKPQKMLDRLIPATTEALGGRF
jgi:hypothetical protein